MPKAEKTDTTTQRAAPVKRSQAIAKATVAGSQEVTALRRRALLTGASLSLIAGPALVASAASMSSNPDAALLAACARYIGLENAYRSSSARPDDDLVPPPGYDDAMAAVADIPATTLEGMRAKARAILHYQAGGSYGISAIDLMRHSLLEDLAGGAA